MSETRRTRQRVMATERRKARREQGLCIQCGEPANGYSRCANCKASDQKRTLAYAKQSYRKLKDEVFAEYGGECACCGLDDWRFLTIDHINNDGASHRKELGGRTRDLLKWLKANNFPKDRFQLLCWNCNMAKARHGGICPHQTSKLALAA